MEAILKFIKTRLITKKQGLNASFVKNPLDFLKKNNAPGNLLENAKTKESLADLIYTHKIIIPKNTNKNCVVCGKETSLKSLKDGYRYCCSLECNRKSPLRIQKGQETCLQKYGVKSILMTETHKEHTSKILKEKYNVKNPLELRKNFKCSDSKKAKIKSTLESKSKDEKLAIIQKRKETLKKRYNVENLYELEFVKDKRKNTMLNRYGVEFFSQSNKWKSKISKQLHHSKNHIANLENFNKDFILANFVKKDRFHLKDCEKYFNTSESYLNKWKRENCVEIPNKHSKSQTQQKIFDFINCDNKFYNTKNVIPPFEIDIFLSDFNLAIEYNGLLTHSQGLSKYDFLNTPQFPKDYHLKKTLLCREKGIQLLHIFEGENLDLWKSVINAKIGKNEVLYARKCKIAEVSYTEAKDFLNENHFQGFCNYKIAYGLYFENVLVSLMTFSKSRFNKNFDYELLRFCNRKFLNVVGGASKLLKHFQSKFKGSIISYANLRWSNGKLYESLNFEKIGYSSPNYFYFKEKEKILYSRNCFQKHKLKDILENFDASLTEEENMFKDGYRKIYDCGNLIFCKKF